ncbi:S-adenosyl-L-methionine-dependent methyltransferase [Rickenella mellea]|uniref:S-adenosyl-L-methionine-dependent methyltransferase n=1 Tax=Rickenella mellea TaxID=50990 RepID=A0A4Y7PVR1_9AGAM|nr:S-adenosyl-L-methionine-dependent methyltransferase [Rickenella mellea]
MSGSDFSFGTRASGSRGHHSAVIDDVDMESVHSSLTSAPSVYSYNSSRDGTTLLRFVQGRAFNAQNDLYFFPADEEEFTRLEKNDLKHLVAIGRLYVEQEKVQRILAPSPPLPKQILDLGTGTAGWAMAMAQEFPHAEVIGIDLAPNTSRFPLPPNCRLEIDDFNLGLPHYYNSCDLVHSRAVANGVQDFKWYINEAAKCLKPGGMLLMTEGNHNLLNAAKEHQECAFGEGGPGQSWFARALFEGHNTLKRRGSSVDARVLLENLMIECPLLTDVGAHTRLMPVGPWDRGSTPEEDQQKRILGILTRQTSIDLIGAMEPLYVSAGYSAADVKQMVDGTKNELNQLTEHMYMKWKYAYGTRNTVPIPTDDECEPEKSFQERH